MHPRSGCGVAAAKRVRPAALLASLAALLLLGVVCPQRASAADLCRSNQPDNSYLTGSRFEGADGDQCQRVSIAVMFVNAGMPVPDTGIPMTKSVVGIVTVGLPDVSVPARSIVARWHWSPSAPSKRLPVR